MYRTMTLWKYVRLSLLALVSAIMLSACGGGSGGGNTTAANGPGPGSGGGSQAAPASASTASISWPENTASEQISGYTIQVKNLATNVISTLTVSTSGASPDAVPAGGWINFTASLKDLGILGSGTYQITIVANNSAGSSLPSDPEFVAI